MATLNVIQSQKEKADKLIVEMAIKFKEQKELFDKSKIILKNIQTSDKKYQALADKILKLTNTTSEALNNFQAERRKITDLYNKANDFFNKKYTPLIEKIENQDTGLTSNLKKSAYHTVEIENISRNCKKQYELITKYATNFKTTLTKLQIINTSVKEIYKDVQKYKSDSIIVIDSINKANQRVTQFEKNVERLNRISAETEFEIKELYNKSSQLFDEISEIKEKSKSTFDDILTIYMECQPIQDVVENLIKEERP